MRKVRKELMLAAAAIALLVMSWPAAGQHHHGGPNAAATNFASLPAPPRMTGIGTATIKISTKSADVQKYFDQGLNLLHAFWDMEAYRAFREAARLDPNCAMAYWGIYNALGQNAQETAAERSEALKKAVELMASASEHEQYYIRAISLLAEQGKGRPAWIAEMEALIDKYPEDVEAKLLLANSLSSPASSYLPNGRPREGKMYGRAILQNLLRTHPEHSAVHHYWIHAAENGPRPEEALESAERLVKLAPNSGHILHMPGHIYYRLGMYEKARKAFLSSLAFDEKYMRENNIHPINNWNYTHNLDYLVANCAEEGRYTEAAKYAKALVDLPTDDDRLRSTGLGYIIYGGHTATTRLQMRFGMWDAAAADIERTVFKNKDSLSARYQAGLLSYLKGMSAVDKGNAEEADSHLQQLQKTSDEMANLRGQNASDWYSGYAGRVLAVHALDLRGSVASLKGQHDDAMKILTDAAEREQNLGYWEPPHYTRPVLESLAAAHMRAGKYDEAIRAYEKILKNRPNSGFALAGIARAYKKAGNETRSAEYYRQLAAAWRNADKELSQVKETTR
jgi:tetratricopeptide (TPR) repeat protein